MSNYETRYCCFIDILGFRELVQQLSTNPQSFETIRDTLSKVHQPSTPVGDDCDFKAQSISDAVAISTGVEPAGLIAIYKAVRELTEELLLRGFFIRGALVKGQLYHDRHMIFGPALLRAYQLESTVAVYPRVIASGDVVSDIERLNDTVVLSRDPPHVFVGQLSDGLRFLDVLAPLKSEWVRQGFKDDGNEPRFNRYLAMVDKISERFSEAQDNPNHYAKVRWFAAYWNDSMPNWNTFSGRRIVAPGNAYYAGPISHRR